MIKSKFAKEVDLNSHRKKDWRAVHNIWPNIKDLHGAQGDQGPQGDQGAQGAQGNQGSQGPQGFQGAVGNQGPQGYQGNVGTQGPQGTTGPQGAAGPQGATGATGSQGAQGNVGATGPQGSTGSQGATGSKGDQGDVGSTGPQGSTGSQGATGSKGDQGDQGEPGGAISGMIAIFDTSCPGGWTRVSAFDNYFIRGNSSYGGTGGVTQHKHLVNAPDTATAGDDAAIYTAEGDAEHPAESPHIHMLDIVEFHSAYCSVNEHLPPYINVVFCKKD